MVDLEFEIDWGQGFVRVNPPINWKAMELEVIWTNDNPSAQIRGTDFEWTGQEAIKMYRYRQDGLTGNGPGISEGLPLRIKACLNYSVTIFEGIVALGDRTVRWECDVVKAPSRESGRIDWLNEVAAAFDFHFLRSLAASQPGRIVPGSDFKKVPYAITEIPDYTQAMICSISIFVLVKELQEAITKVAQLIAQLSGDASTAVFTAGLAASTLLARIIMIALQITYLFIIVVALIQLVNDLISNIIQLKKHKIAMRAQTHFQRAAQHLGLVFSSSIFDSGDYKDATWMPAKSVIPNLSNPLNVFHRPADEGQNFPNNAEVYGYHAGSFADFITDMMKFHNAELKIAGNQLIFRERNSYNFANAFQLPNTGEVGYSHNYPDPHATNLSELPSAYTILWSVDQTELNTLYRYRGTSVRVQIRPVVTRNKKNWTFGPPVIVRLPAAHARRKEYLTRVEVLLNGVVNAVFGFVNFILSGANIIINAVNWVLSLFGGNAPQLGTIPLLPTNILNNRVDWLALSGDSFQMPKYFIGQASGSDWVIHPQSEVRMSAQRLMSFHGTNLATRGNQQLVFTDKRLPFCCADYIRILGSNILVTADGFNGKFDQLKWDFSSDQATGVQYRVYRNFSNNFTEIITQDGEQ